MAAASPITRPSMAAASPVPTAAAARAPPLQHHAAAAAAPAKAPPLQHHDDAAPHVSIWDVSSITPSSPTPPHSLYLCGIDHVLKFAAPNRTILFYSASPNPIDAAASLRRSISAALVPFYPLAGRVIIDQASGRLALSCNDAGVEFVQAHCDLPFSAVQSDGSFPIRPFFRRLVPMDDCKYSDHIGDPIISVQITSFADGGISVGFAMSHVVVDGFSCWTFIRAVSEHCLGIPFSVEPLHARTLLRPDTFLLNTFPDLPADEVLNPAAAPYAGSEDVSNGSRESNFMLLEPEKLQQVIVSFDREAIGKLKEECRGGGAAATEWSTFQVLAAYLWKRMTAAQGLEEETRVDFRVPLDVRGRMRPPLTAAFFGNAVVGVTVGTTAGELVAERLAETVERIKEGVKRGDDAYIKRAIVARENMDLRKLIQGRVVLFNIRNASKFPVFRSSDFGWGRANAVRPPWEWREGEVTWYPSAAAAGGGTVDVILGLSESTARAFSSPALLRHDPLRYLFAAST